MTNAGSWGKRREYISGLFEPVLSALEGLESKQAAKLKRREHSATNHITDVSRRRLIDGLVHLWRSIVDKNVKAGIEDEHWWVYWGGVLDEIEFLSRLYDLDQLPSNDDRFATARQDIRQHCIANPADWDSDWIYHDDRFGLNTSDDALLVFLAETLHPVVRPDPVEVKLLHDFYNSVLIHDGYEIVQTGSISGAPVFGYRRIGGGVPGTMKNLIFAADGPKLEFVLGDAVNNDVLVVRNEEFCLVYDRALGTTGLTWEIYFPGGGRGKHTPRTWTTPTSGETSTSGFRRRWRVNQSVFFSTPTASGTPSMRAEQRPPPCCPRCTSTSTRRPAESEPARTVPLRVSAWTSCCCFRTALASFWRWMVNSTTPLGWSRGTPRPRGCTRAWSPKIGHCVSRGTRCTALAGMS